LVIYIVLAASLLFEGGSWIVGTPRLSPDPAPFGMVDAFRQSKDPPAFIVVFEDSAAVLGLLVAAAGTTAAILTGDSRWDGIASLVDRRILAGVALLLGQESKALLIGERADPKLSDAIIRMAAGVAACARPTASPRAAGAEKYRCLLEH